VNFCEEMANIGKTVIVAALDGTFQRKASNEKCQGRHLKLEVPKCKSEGWLSTC